MSEFPAFQIRVNLTLSGTIDIVSLEYAPTQPSVLSISFANNGDGTMTGTVSLSPLVAGDHVSSRLVVVNVAGVDLPVVEALNSPAQFVCSENDAISVVCTDINTAGSTASDPFTTTAILPLVAPTKPSVLGVTFSA